MSLLRRHPLSVGLVGLLIAALVGLLVANADALPVIGGGTTYTARFTEAAGLDPGNEVRVAGVKVGKVTGVSLDGDRVRVTFNVKDTWIGDSSTVSIAIKTLLGEKYLAVDPLGAGKQDPSTPIPTSRTVSPYDVTQALNGLGSTFDQLDTKRLAQAFNAVSGAFANTPPQVRTAAHGLAALSLTLSKRDASLARLLDGTRQITQTLAGQNGNFQTLLTDGNQLLGEVRMRRDAIHALLVGATNLGTQLAGLIQDNTKQLAPTLAALDRVTGVLNKNQKSLDKTLSLAGPYYRLLTNALGTGHWFDAYLCGLVPKDYLPTGTQPATGCMPPNTTSGGSR
ncbi:ABC transporter substrate-binding protein [Mangrovactinospora gilvigrisea]|uniref:ABC transporter substrate-binding protein n=1 Tax=Mangrovactinospora gilvigrisea TaxID=1428644 RepID=A0A1J7BBQ2_9ACTN|nr:MCE family protein [Mangrovactinospora gilvigrisea]OIV36029.1 ABC transporter substrate-binding protein [Mangrovactinospora gilvigrisea]